MTSKKYKCAICKKPCIDIYNCINDKNKKLFCNNCIDKLWRDVLKND